MKINKKTIIIDLELGIIKSTKHTFPKAYLVGCLFHYENAIHPKLSAIGLYKAQYSETSVEMLKIYGTFPFILHKDRDYIDKTLKKLSQNKIYKEFADYFKEQWIPHLNIDNSLEYNLISKSFRNNSFIVNYMTELKDIWEIKD